MKNRIVKNSMMLPVISFIAYLTITAAASAQSQYAQIAYADDPKSGIVRIGTNAFIGSGETAKGVFVLNGDAVINGKVEENAMIVRGNAEINGEVGRDVISVLGTVKISSNAKIKGNIFLLGSKANISPGAEIGGNKIDVDFGKLFPPAISGLIDYIRYGVFMLRPLPPQVKAVWGWLLISLIFSIAVVLVFPRAVSACAESIQNRPITSFLIGLAALCLFAPFLMMLLAISIVGLLAIPFVIFAMIIASAFGIITMCCIVGYRLAKISNGEIALSSLVALLIGFVLLSLLGMLPVIGLIVSCVVSTIGLGGALMTAIDAIFKETIHSVRKTAPPLMPQEEKPAEEKKPVEPAPAAFEASSKADSSPQSLQVEQPAQQITETPVAAGQISKTAEQFDAAAQTTTVQQPPVIPEQPPKVSEKPPIDYSTLPRVGFCRRFVATLIDLCLFAIPFAIFHGFGWALWMLYHFLMWALNGATVGDIVMKIKIVHETGEPIDWKTSLIRTLAALLSIVPLFIGFFWAGWSSEKKSWHDYIAGTIVVKLPESFEKRI